MPRGTGRIGSYLRRSCVSTSYLPRRRSHDDDSLIQPSSGERPPASWGNVKPLTPFSLCASPCHIRPDGVSVIPLGALGP